MAEEKASHDKSQEENSPPWANYKYTPTERDIFAPSVYKDRLLPLWRFRTPALAKTSTAALWDVYLQYEGEDDFVGMDNARKYLQMGMTRAKRYANNKGGKKYDSKGAVLKKDQRKGHEVEDWGGRKEKEEASRIFRDQWEKVKIRDAYVARKEEWVKAQREWGRAHRMEGASERKRKCGHGKAPGIEAKQAVDESQRKV